MASGEPHEKYTLRTHLVAVTDAVEQNLDVIGGRLAEEKFITQRQMRTIIDFKGDTNPAKASKLMRTVEAKIGTEDEQEREEWFEKFVLILLKNTAEEKLGKKLIKTFGKLTHMWYATY